MVNAVHTSLAVLLHVSAARVFVGTLRKELVAIDAADGAELPGAHSASSSTSKRSEATFVVPA